MATMSSRLGVISFKIPNY